MVILCPICGALNKLDIDEDCPDSDYEICTNCGCNYEEIENVQTELH